MTADKHKLNRRCHDINRNTETLIDCLEVEPPK